MEGVCALIPPAEISLIKIVIHREDCFWSKALIIRILPWAETSFRFHRRRSLKWGRWPVGGLSAELVLFPPPIFCSPNSLAPSLKTNILSFRITYGQALVQNAGKKIIVIKIMASQLEMTSRANRSLLSHPWKCHSCPITVKNKIQIKLVYRR